MGHSSVQQAVAQLSAIGPSACEPISALAFSSPEHTRTLSAISRQLGCDSMPQQNAASPMPQPQPSQTQPQPTEPVEVV